MFSRHGAHIPRALPNRNWKLQRLLCITVTLRSKVTSMRNRCALKHLFTCNGFSPLILNSYHTRTQTLSHVDGFFFMCRRSARRSCRNDRHVHGIFPFPSYFCFQERV